MAKKEDTSLREAVALLKQGADVSRLSIVRMLGKSPTGSLDVTAICKELSANGSRATQPAVSHHLSLLRHGRVVVPTRSGKHNFYALTELGWVLYGVLDYVASGRTGRPERVVEKTVGPVARKVAWKA